jgi:hypothetical protein
MLVNLIQSKIKIDLAEFRVSNIHQQVFDIIIGGTIVGCAEWLYYYLVGPYSTRP